MGTLCPLTPSGSKLAGRQSFKYRKRVCLSKESLLKRIFSPYFKIWWPASLEPMGHWRHYVSHFKGLISDQRPSDVQGRNTTFTLFHTLLKKAILHYKKAIVCSHLSMAVYRGFDSLLLGFWLCIQIHFSTLCTNYHGADVQPSGYNLKKVSTCHLTFFSYVFSVKLQCWEEHFVVW